MKILVEYSALLVGVAVHSHDTQLSSYGAHSLYYAIRIAARPNSTYRCHLPAGYLQSHQPTKQYYLRFLNFYNKFTCRGQWRRHGGQGGGVTAPPSIRLKTVPEIRPEPLSFVVVERRVGVPIPLRPSEHRILALWQNALSSQ